MNFSQFFRPFLFNMKLETLLSLKHEMSKALEKENPLEHCINVVRSFAQAERSEVKEFVQLQTECLEQCAKVIDPKSPLGMQIKNTLEGANKL